jgi:predicted small secreted protein
MRIIIVSLAVLSLTACANTFEGVKRDSTRIGEKMHTISKVVTAP